jgi:hypothetical protein
MQKMFVIAAALAAAAGPAFAQTSPDQAGTEQANPTSTNQASAEQPKMVTKIVCKKVEEERGIGSRLSSTSKVCRKVTVPASDVADQNKQAKRGH